jgi:hypothetical protein
MAKQFWPKGNPVGECIAIAELREPFPQIIGVVADVRDTELSQDPMPIVYFPPAQVSDANMAAAMRTSRSGGWSAPR